MGQGTPVNIGTYTGNTFVINNETLIPTVKVITSLGSFDNPATRCQAILDENPAATDGYYWIRLTGTANKFKTYCDMEDDHAWTLVKSKSERQILVRDRTQAESIASQTEKSPVTTREGKFNEYNFALSGATVNSIGLAQGTGAKMYRFNIKEKGHTTDPNASVEEIENSTIAPFDDIWAPENYWDVTILIGNPATGNFTSTASNNINQGKIFGVQFGKPFSNSANYFWNGWDGAGTRFADASPPGMYSAAGFFTGYYGSLGGVASNTAANEYTYTYQRNGDDAGFGRYFTFRLYYINDLFGIYMGTEWQLNHHIGTCANDTDDYGGAAYCNPGWANWRPHNFNKIFGTNDYEGRIVQYWVR
jgi:hypothetical protein